MSEGAIDPVVTPKTGPAVPSTGTPSAEAGSRADRAEIRGETSTDESAKMIMDLRRRATEMGFISAGAGIASVGQNGNSLVPWETGGNSCLRRLLIQDGAQMNANMEAADREREFRMELTRRTTLRHGEPVSAPLEWPGFGRNGA